MSDVTPQKKNNWTWLIMIGFLIVFAAIVYGTAQVLELFWHAPTVAVCDGKPMGTYDKCGSYYPGSETPQTTTDATHQLSADQFSYTVFVYLTALGIVFVGAIAIGTLFSLLGDGKKDSSGQDAPHDK